MKEIVHHYEYIFYLFLFFVNVIAIIILFYFQAVTLILDSNHSADVKEQALCILGNIGDGDSAKEFIMSREDILNKIQEYMVNLISMFIFHNIL